MPASSSFHPPPVWPQFLEFISVKILPHRSKECLPIVAVKFFFWRWGHLAGSSDMPHLGTPGSPWWWRHAEGSDSSKHMEARARTGVAGSYAPIIKKHLLDPFIRAEAGLAKWRRRANEGVRWLIVWAKNRDRGKHGRWLVFTYHPHGLSTLDDNGSMHVCLFF